MKMHRIASMGTALDFDAAIKRASAVADELIGENMLLFWDDRERDLESPAHASECHEGLSHQGGVGITP
ncbi:MAG TPA: AF1514 family protein [Gallionella sp.]|nr:AF1514 family protein [Gallionella sp.]